MYYICLCGFPLGSWALLWPRAGSLGSAYVRIQFNSIQNYYILRESWSLLHQTYVSRGPPYTCQHDGCQAMKSRLFLKLGVHGKTVSSFRCLRTITRCQAKCLLKFQIIRNQLLLRGSHYFLLQKYYRYVPHLFSFSHSSTRGSSMTHLHVLCLQFSSLNQSRDVALNSFLYEVLLACVQCPRKKGSGNIYVPTRPTTRTYVRT